MILHRSQWGPLNLSDEMGLKENNNTIRNLTGEYKKIEPDCREGVQAQLERIKQLCKELNNLYENRMI